jgi:hypothetical protein
MDSRTLNNKQMESLTQVSNFLESAIVDTKCDLQSDWLEERERSVMAMHLQLLIIAKGNLDLIANDGEGSQIFKSVIKF